jgi:hypothetical protein
MFFQTGSGFIRNHARKWLVAGFVLGAIVFSGVTGYALPKGGDPTTGAAEPTGCYCVGRVGNVNCDYLDKVTMADVAKLINHLFIDGVRLPNLEEANADGDPEGKISMSDVLALVDHLYISRAPLPECPKPYNNPPETQILGYVEGIPYVNGLTPGNWATGVRMRWGAYDIVDHPYEQPTFKYEYRMYGPYTDDNLNLIISRYRRQVFITNDGHMYRFGEPPDTVHCDTFYSGVEIDSVRCQLLPTHHIVCDTIWLPGGNRVVWCDTILIDTLEGANIFGRIDTLMDVEDPEFVSDPQLNRIAASSWNGGSQWTPKTRDSLFNLFAYDPCDTTRQMRFIFWVRAQDPTDSTVFDPTPAFRFPSVIDAKHERDVLVTDWGIPANKNGAFPDSVRSYWNRAIDTWIQHDGLENDVIFDSARDFVNVLDLFDGYQMLPLALKYKVVVVHQDAMQSGLWNYESYYREEAAVSIAWSLATGNSAWVAARVPFGSYVAYASPMDTAAASASYKYLFGIDSYTFPGWGYYIYSNQDGVGPEWGYGLPRTEDFVGAFSLNEELWPELAIDSARLHSDYTWGGRCQTDPLGPAAPFMPWRPDLAALPQVGYVVPTSDAEVMYTYKSKYGPVHPIIPELSFEGLPVMVRLDRGIFRTVHSNFTPLALEETAGQQMVDSVLSWLYEKWLQGSAEPPPGQMDGELIRNLIGREE